jgi:hypothetical protein
LVVEEERKTSVKLGPALTASRPGLGLTGEQLYLGIAARGGRRGSGGEWELTGGKGGQAKAN